MFGDHSMQTASLKKERLALKIERMREKMRRVQLEYQGQLAKKQYVERFIREHDMLMVGDKGPKRVREMSISEVEVEMHRRLMRRRQNRASTLITKVFRGYKVRKAY